MEDPEIRFYHDLPKEAQARWISELRPIPSIAHLSPVTYEAYQHHPATYLFCEQDQTVPLCFQEQMVERSGTIFKTESCSASHSPCLSQPKIRHRGDQSNACGQLRSIGHLDSTELYHALLPKHNDGEHGEGGRTRGRYHAQCGGRSA